MGDMSEQFGVLFYWVPVDVKYQSLNDVPDYFGRAIPWVMVLIVLEYFLGKWRKQQLYTLKDTVMSFSLSMLQNILAVFVHQFNTIPYMFVYNATSDRSRLLLHAQIRARIPYALGFS